MARQRAWAALLLLGLLPATRPVEVSDADLALSRAFASTAFGCAQVAALPLSFHLGANSSRELLPGWGCSESPARRGRGGAAHTTITFSDPTSGLTLAVRRSLAFTDHPPPRQCTRDSDPQPACPPRRRGSR